MPVILHCCGRVRDLIPYFIEEGIDCLQPLEVKSGMDLIELKEEFGGEISFMGGIDVRLMALDNPKPLEREIREKLTAAKEDGGYIYHSDHSVPNNVSFQQYKRVIELVKKYGRYD
jgi:uroporphyrinogen decarboxylase